MPLLAAAKYERGHIAPAPYATVFPKSSSSSVMTLLQPTHSNALPRALSRRPDAIIEVLIVPPQNGQAKTRAELFSSLMLDCPENPPSANRRLS
jgi:hypothetical protein